MRKSKKRYFYQIFTKFSWGRPWGNHAKCWVNWPKRGHWPISGHFLTGYSFEWSSLYLDLMGDFKPLTDSTVTRKII